MITKKKHIIVLATWGVLKSDKKPQPCEDIYKEWINVDQNID